jgi:hypothetical protein
LFNNNLFSGSKIITGNEWIHTVNMYTAKLIKPKPIWPNAVSEIYITDEHTSKNS